MGRHWKAGNEPASHRPASDQPASDEPPADEPASDESARKDPARKDPARKDPASGQRLAGLRSGDDQALSDQAPHDQTPSDQASSDQTPNDQALSNQTPNDQALSNQALSNQAPNEQAPSEQAGRIWAAMRALVESQPTKQRLRDALDLGRGSGRVKSLMWLTEGPLSLSGLAEAVGVDAPYATLIVDSLEQRGLVEREADPADRRRKLVTLTPAGRDAVAQVLRIQLEPPPGFGSLSAAELDTLEKLVWRIMAGPR